MCYAIAFYSKELNLICKNFPVPTPIAGLAVNPRDFLDEEKQRAARARFENASEPCFKKVK